VGPFLLFDVLNCVVVRAGGVVVATRHRALGLRATAVMEQFLAIFAPAPVVLTHLSFVVQVVVVRAGVIVMTTGSTIARAVSSEGNRLRLATPAPIVLRSTLRIGVAMGQFVFVRSSEIVTAAFRAYAGAIATEAHVRTFAAPAPSVLELLVLVFRLGGSLSCLLLRSELVRACDLFGQFAFTEGVHFVQHLVHVVHFLIVHMLIMTAVQHFLQVGCESVDNLKIPIAAKSSGMLVAKAVLHKLLIVMFSVR